MAFVFTKVVETNPVTHVIVDYLKVFILFQS